MATILTTPPPTVSTTAPTIAVDGSATNGQYSPSTQSKNPGSIVQIRESGDLVFLVYATDPAPENVIEFQKFYETQITAWMKKRGVRHAHAWMAGSMFVVLASIEADVPWIDGADAVEGLQRYLATTKQPDVSELPVFSNPVVGQR